MPFTGFALFLFAALTCSAGLVERPMDAEAAKVRHLLLDGKFSELEAYETRARDLSLTLSDGQPLHSAWAFAIGCACSFSVTGDPAAELEKFRARVTEWRSAYPDSTSAKIAEATYYIQHAWAVRGSGYSNQVLDSAWEIFRRDVAEAARLLDAIGADAGDQPDWYVVRLSVMRLQNADKPQFSDLLDKALARYPSYLPIYFEGAYYYQPKWHGSIPELAAFIDRAVALTRERAGETLYARLEWATWTSNAMFRNGQASWPRMKAGFERLVADYPDSWNMNAFANFACLAGDPQTTLDLMGKIQGSIALKVWDTMEFYGQCKSWALRKTGGSAK